MIEFKDLPDTSTPITADNLNNNFNELNEKIETCKTVTFNNEWLIGNVVHGGNILILIPIYNPNNVRPVLSLTSSQIFTQDSVWVNVPVVSLGLLSPGVQSFGKTYAILRFDDSGVATTKGQCYIMRLTGTLTVE